MKKYIYIALAIPLLISGAKAFAEAERVIVFEKEQSTLSYQIAEGEPEPYEEILPAITLEDIDAKLTEIEFKIEDMNYKIDVLSNEPIITPDPVI